jgi:hypothetical protein
MLRSQLNENRPHEVKVLELRYERKIEGQHLAKLRKELTIKLPSIDANKDKRIAS